ncbi:MAG: DUF2800 domain-containing protein [Pseudomonadota bacterium]
MAPNTHAEYGASGAKRYLECPGSIGLSRSLGPQPRKSSEFAAEGTLAHAIAETCLLTGKKPHDFVGETRTCEGYTFDIDDEFADAVKVYVDYVNGLRLFGAEVHLEVAVDPSWAFGGAAQGLPPTFGTADTLAYLPDERSLHIVDLKFGRGVVVEAEGNPQIRYYGTGGLGAKVFQVLNGKPLAQMVDRVTLTIVQPRAWHAAGPARSETLSVRELTDWANDDLRTGIERAEADNGQTFKPGSWCQFCPAFAHCKARRDHAAAMATDLAAAAFGGKPLENVDPKKVPAAVQQHGANISPEDLSALLDKIALWRPWVKAVEDYAEDLVSNGGNIPGYALRPTTPRRHWQDDDEDKMRSRIAFETPLRIGEVTERRLLSPAKVQKKIGKKKYDAHVAQFVETRSTGMKLEPEDDPRRRIKNRGRAPF